MASETLASRDELVLVLAPTGRDGTLACEILIERAGVRVHACIDAIDLATQIGRGCGAVVIAEEALDGQSTGKLIDALGAQLAWSDLPLIILGRADDMTLMAAGMPVAILRQRGNVTVLDRPLRIVTLVSAVQSALRARRRQYEVRDLLTETRNAVRQRDQFLAMLGHELRDPLGAIANALTVVDAACPDADELELEQRGILRRQTDHLARLVDDLLDVSRITSGKVVLQPRPVDLCQLARRAAQSVEGPMRAQLHELDLDIACDPVMVQADPVRMEQVVNNLLTNAIKYTPEGGRIQLTVAARGGHAELRVRDNGIGISRELLPRVFELFTQAEGALDRAQGGLGIGLTLVRSLVEMHDGEVHAHSEGPGKGSEFVIVLPRLAPAQPQPHTADPPARSAHGNGSVRHILIIEDQADARRALQRLLQIWGHHVDVAEDGPRGVEAAARIHPDLAFVDVGLPGLDGYEVARQIRQHLGKAIRLIALTGYGQPEDRERAYAAGFDQHLVKPVDRDQLARSVADASDASVNGKQQHV